MLGCQLLLVVIASVMLLLRSASSSSSSSAAAAAVNTTTVPHDYDYDYDYYDNHTTSGNNTTMTTTTSNLLEASLYAHWQIALIAVACSVLVLGTVIGNVLVVTAVIIVRRLRTHSNLLIMSLAISDLLVALLDMPFAAVYEVSFLYKKRPTLSLSISSPNIN